MIIGSNVMISIWALDSNEYSTGMITFEKYSIPNSFAIVLFEIVYFREKIKF